MVAMKEYIIDGKVSRPFSSNNRYAFAKVSCNRGDQINTLYVGAAR